MEIFIKVVQFVASLSLLILIHEFGHFLFARLFRIRVEKFYLSLIRGFRCSSSSAVTRSTV